LSVASPPPCYTPLLHTRYSLFFLHATPTTDIYTLSLHDALPISPWSMPTLTAATAPMMGDREIILYFSICLTARARATYAPVMEATRVPPSAWRTSQSRIIERSPRIARSITERSERPIKRWISWVRPLGRPLATSRAVRVEVARGSIEYSAVTQPLPVLRRNGGTEDSTLAAHRTWVFPTVMRAEPSAVFR